MVNQFGNYHGGRCCKEQAGQPTGNAFTPADTVAIVAPQIAAINKPGSGDGR